jgi:hypothetical protein
MKEVIVSRLLKSYLKRNKEKFEANNTYEYYKNKVISVPVSDRRKIALKIIGKVRCCAKKEKMFVQTVILFIVIQ